MKNKFLTAGEHQLLGNIASLIGFKSAQLLILAWSIKEAMFKWYGNGGVDFKQHLRINKIINNGNEFLADCTFQKHDPINLKVHGLFFNDKFLAWIAASNDQQ
ncbi:MAG: 4'-phosphopantetheinyl transferase superfamily protein [Ferruginibacter sp.]